ncbi:MAG TPA: aspartate kinase [Patescibacteria group bacterium]
MTNLTKYVKFLTIMITVPEATKKIIERSRYLAEAMSKGLINYSALARYIRPELEEMLFKDVSESSIIMALKRLEPYFRPKYKHTNVFQHSPEMIVRSNLIELTVANSEAMTKKLPSIMDVYTNQQKYFFTLTEGVSETTIIASRDLLEKIKTLINGEKVLETFTNLSSITIRLPQEVLNSPGIFYFFLKSLAWEGISIVEIVSTYSEFTIILEDKEVNKAFAVLKSLFDHA